MEVNKKQLADIFGASIRTIQNWQEQGMPVLRGGGKGNEVLYDSAAVIKWYAERDAEIENEKLRREVEELRQASEADLQPGTIEYERHRLTRAQADAQELKNARDSAEVVETAFCTFVLSRIAGEIASILDGIPLSVQRRFPELENRHVDFLKRDIIKAMNKAAALEPRPSHITPPESSVSVASRSIPPMITPEISPTVSTAVTINMMSTGAMARISNTILTGISLGMANQEACATLFQLSTHALVNSTPSAVTPVVGSTRPMMKAAA